MLAMLLTVTSAFAAGETINVGCLQDITGPTSSLGNMVTAGAQWAVDEINAAGGVNGKQINLIVYDTKGDVTEAINAYTRCQDATASAPSWTSRGQHRFGHRAGVREQRCADPGLCH